MRIRSMHIFAFAAPTLIISLLLSSTPSQASTFVGNGGNAGDVEWLVTLQQIETTIKWVQNLPADKLCTCTETYSNHSTCDVLKSLSATQTKYCQDVLRAQLPDLLELVATSNRVRVNWTYDPIEVREHGRLRAVDAVTERTLNRISMNPEKFRSLQSAERIFLISHELFHLTEWQQKPMEDVGAVGPFTDRDGGRDLINAMAATFTVQAAEQKIPELYRRALKRPQGWKQNWFDLSFGASFHDDGRTFAIEDYETVQFKYRRYFGPYGLTAGYRFQSGDKVVLSGIKGTEEIQTFSLGASYRIFPFKDPLTFWGQSHLSLGAGVDFANGKYEIKDDTVGGSAEKTQTGLNADVSYAIPLVAGLWAQASVAYQTVPSDYVIAGVQMESKKSVITTSLGVSYAF